MRTLVCTNISIALRLLEKVPCNSTSTKITLTLFYVKSNINVSCLDSTVIDVKAKRRHESRSLWYRRIFLRKALVFIELSSNISLWAAKHENTIFTTTAILLKREARQARGDSWLVCRHLRKLLELPAETVLISLLGVLKTILLGRGTWTGVSRMFFCRSFCQSRQYKNYECRESFPCEITLRIPRNS